MLGRKLRVAMDFQAAESIAVPWRIEQVFRNLEAAHEFLMTRRLVVLQNGAIVLPNALQVRNPIEARTDHQHGKACGNGSSVSRARNLNLPQDSTRDPVGRRYPNRVKQAEDYGESVFDPGRKRQAYGRRPTYNTSAACLLSFGRIDRSSPNYFWRIVFLARLMRSFTVKSVKPAACNPRI